MAGRKPLAIDRDKLVKILEDKDQTGGFTNRSKLYDAVATEYNQESEVKIKGHNLVNRVSDWGMILKTPLGKRGRSDGTPIPKGTPGTSRSKRTTKQTRLMLATVPAKYQKLAMKSRTSLKNAVKLKCLDCCAYEISEVRACHIVSCPLWPFLKRKVESHESNIVETTELCNAVSD